MKKLFIFLGLSLVVFALYVTFFAPSPELYSPLSSATPQENRITGKQEYLILGFAPYWNLKKLSNESLNSITHFAYFHLLLNGDGSVYKKLNRREEEPGFTNYKRLLAGSVDRGNKPLIITVMPESQTALSQSISSKSARDKTINSLINLVK